ncbi:MAG: LON peptidase substrate-binding domain-containing protein [Terriglobia bacterium]
MVLLSDEEMQTVGCTAEVIKVIRRYEDGRLNILTQGPRRFEILFTNDAKAYLRGGVRFFDDDPGASTSRLEPAMPPRSFLATHGTSRPSSRRTIRSAGAFLDRGRLPDAR